MPETCKYCDHEITDADLDADYYKQEEAGDETHFYHVGCWRAKWEDG